MGITCAHPSQRVFTMARMIAEPGTEHPPHDQRTLTLPRKPSLTLATASVLELCPDTLVWQVWGFQQPLASPEGDLSGFQGSWGQALGDSLVTVSLCRQLCFWQSGGCLWGFRPWQQGDLPGSVARGKPSAICVFRAQTCPHSCSSHASLGDDQRRVR